MPLYKNNAAPAGPTAPSYTYTASSTGRDLTPADAGTVVLSQSADPVTFTIPRGDNGQAMETFPIGGRIEIQQMGAGQVTIANATFVTILPTTLRKTAGQWSTVYITRQSTNTWFLSGQLSA